MWAKRLSALILLASITGCVDTSRSPPHASHYQPLMNAYVECNVSTSRQFARIDGDVLSLGIAAEAACGRERQILLNAVAADSDPVYARRVLSRTFQSRVNNNAGLIAGYKTGG
jgi:hypothetical protein